MEKVKEALLKLKQHLKLQNKRTVLILGLIGSILIIGFFPQLAKLYESVFQAGDGEIENKVIADIWISNTTNIDDKIFATGDINAYKHVDLRSEISGKVTALNINEGEKVESGKLLVKINDNDLRAELNRAEYKLEMAKETEERQRQLFERGATSQEEYDRALLDLRNIETEIEIIQAQIARTEIRAPFSGVLGLKHISSGAYITPSTRIASLQDISSVKIDFFIPERYRMRIQKGSKIEFTVQGVDSIFTGEVYAIEPSIDPNSRSLMIRAISDNESGLLSPGSFVNLNLIFESFPETILLPAIALLSDGISNSVFVLQNDKIRRQPVQTGLRTAESVQITEGLSKGDSVLISGIMNAQEGMKVSIRNISE